ncbi:trans-aconitate 2-methyltransferase [Nesterenkonia sp. Act20]|uniref:class I SAM-dependent methyltransferase n=1 Tax=Nesterenkonia sp. Act20 TaxID=1483432 RepID=UPI001C45B36C|nr:class I SAM-dependent methyltransferase [Nesterenkonia sp. Act20]
MNHHTHVQSANHELRRSLDLDAEVFGAGLASALDLSGVTDPGVVVDLGAGTGTGSRLLHERFPEASVIAVDHDPEMLHLLKSQGFTAVAADLDEGFPQIPTEHIDLVWAASSLHHVADPTQLLSGIRHALAPGGSLVVVELATLPTFLSDPEQAALEQRCHEAADAQGWNQHPDWTNTLEDAGFTVTKTALSTRAPATAAARENAQHWLARLLRLENLSAEDRAALAHQVEVPAAELTLAPRAHRTVWVCTARE